MAGADNNYEETSRRMTDLVSRRSGLARRYSGRRETSVRPPSLLSLSLDHCWGEGETKMVTELPVRLEGEEEEEERQVKERRQSTPAAFHYKSSTSLAQSLNKLALSMTNIQVSWNFEVRSYSITDCRQFEQFFGGTWTAYWECHQIWTQSKLKMN